MPIIGSSLAQSVAGAAGAARARDAALPKRADPRRVRDDDQALVHSDEAQGVESVRSLKGSDQEESNEDRRQHPGYTPVGRPKAGDAPRIDVNG